MITFAPRTPRYLIPSPKPLHYSFPLPTHTLHDLLSPERSSSRPRPPCALRRCLRAECSRDACCELLLARKLRHLRHRICVLAHDRPVVPNIVLCAVQYLRRASSAPAERPPAIGPWSPTSDASDPCSVTKRPTPRRSVRIADRSLEGVPGPASRATSKDPQPFFANLPSDAVEPAAPGTIEGPRAFDASSGAIVQRQPRTQRRRRTRRARRRAARRRTRTEPPRQE